MSFTQQELEAAYQQMQQERLADATQADRAAEWLKQQLGLSRCSVHGSNMGCWGQFSSVSPYKQIYNLRLVHETYGPYQEDYVALLDKMPSVTKTGDVYEVDTPFGRYKIVFEYFDNHCTGY
jgi:hypothetical protein